MSRFSRQQWAEMPISVQEVRRANPAAVDGTSGFAQSHNKGSIEVDVMCHPIGFQVLVAILAEPIDA